MDERSPGSETDPVRSGKPLGQALEAGGIRSKAAVLALRHEVTVCDPVPCEGRAREQPPTTPIDSSMCSRGACGATAGQRGSDDRDQLARDVGLLQEQFRAGGER